MSITTLYSPIFKHLLHIKLINFKKTVMGKFIDQSIWVMCTIFVTGYIMQAMGLRTDFGSFQLAGMLASTGIFEMYGNAYSLFMDFEGDQNISYYLTLPTTALVVILNMITFYAIIGVMLSLIMLPIGKLILWNQFALAQVSWIRLIPFFTLSSILYGSVTLLFASYIKNMDMMNSLWTRIIFPAWFLGGFQFSWEMVHKVSPYVSYLLLANPILYVIEGTRAALLGQEGYLPFWLCCCVIALLSILFTWLSYKKMKERLDFVG